MRITLKLWAIVSFAAFSLSTLAAEKTLHGHVPPAAKNLVPIRRLPESQHLRLAIGLSLRNPDQLTALLQQIYDPASPNFHQYLTPQQFADQFGPGASEYQAAIDFALTNGFKIEKTYSNRVVLDVSASVGDIEKALHLQIHEYRHPTEARTFYAPDREPSVPDKLVITDISGLDNYGLAKPHVHTKTATEMAAANPLYGSGPFNLYAGNDFRQAYVPGTALDGTGQVVALVEFDGYYPNDIVNYETNALVPEVPLQNVYIDGYNGYAGGNNLEVALDIELVAAMAPGLSSIMVYEAPNGGSSQIDVLTQIATDDAAYQISSSWTWTGGPTNTTDALFQEMAVQGQSYFSASGDHDAFATGQVDDPANSTTPASSPYVTQVGATDLTTTGPGGSWVSEQVWNAGGGTGSSGGISSYYSIPSWQTGISMTANHGSATMRNIPDVAMVGYAIWVVYDDGTTNAGASGTSCAAPLWAAFTALVNQKAVALNKPSVGFLNPALYSIGKGANYTTDFHDITVGSNTNSVTSASFPAVTGYDLCTGWGTPAGVSLINALIPDDLTIMPRVGFSSSGTYGGPFSPTNSLMTLTNSGSASLNWSAATPPNWLQISPSSGTLTPGGPATTVNVSLTPAATNLYVGSYVTNVWFTNLNDQVAQSIVFSLDVGQLVQNPGFETGDFTHWTLNDTSGQSQVFGNAGPPNFLVHSGNYQAFLTSSGSPSYLSQSIPTVAGQFYQISFWMACDGTTPNEFIFNWNGNSLFDQVNVPNTGGWTNLQFLAKATGSTTTIQFGVRDDSDFLELDDVFAQPIPAPTFQSISKPANAIQFAWNSVSGAVYQVQYKTNITQTNWINLGSTITATNLGTIYSNAIPSDPQRFFRVEVLP